eukprot:5949162-Prymnesium_polylepis.1
MSMTIEACIDAMDTSAFESTVPRTIRNNRSFGHVTRQCCSDASLCAVVPALDDALAILNPLDALRSQPKQGLGKVDGPTLQSVGRQRLASVGVSLGLCPRRQQLVLLARVGHALEHVADVAGLDQARAHRGVVDRTGLLVGEVLLDAFALVDVAVLRQYRFDGQLVGDWAHEVLEWAGSVGRLGRLIRLGLGRLGRRRVLCGGTLVLGFGRGVRLQRLLLHVVRKDGEGVVDFDVVGTLIKTVVPTLASGGTMKVNAPAIV